MTLTSDRDEVVGIFNVHGSRAICNGALRLQVHQCAAAGKPGKGRTELRVRGGRALSIDPKLSGSCVEVDLDRLARSTHHEIDGVEPASLLALQRDVALSLGDVLDDGSALGDCERESEQAGLLDHAVVIRDAKGLCQSGHGREGQKCRPHVCGYRKPA